MYHLYNNHAYLKNAECFRNLICLFDLFHPLGLGYSPGLLSTWSGPSTGLGPSGAGLGHPSYLVHSSDLDHPSYLGHPLVGLGIHRVWAICYVWFIHPVWAIAWFGPAIHQVCSIHLVWSIHQVWAIYLVSLINQVWSLHWV